MSFPIISERVKYWIRTILTVAQIREQPYNMWNSQVFKARKKCLFIICRILVFNKLRDRPKLNGCTDKVNEGIKYSLQIMYWRDLSFIGQPCNFIFRLILEVSYNQSILPGRNNRLIHLAWTSNTLNYITSLVIFKSSCIWGG